MRSVGSDFADLLDLASLYEVVPAGSRILVAVSGGADSVALLCALHAIAHTRSLSLTVAHVNHGLRSEAAEEEAFVLALCSALMIECHVEKLDHVKPPHKLSPEQFWRQSRYAYFEKIMLHSSSRFLALGHTIDDLAETFLFHLARGTGIDGLRFSFFKQAGALPIIRPLWQTNRNRIEQALNDAGQTWMTDASNMDIRFSRNLIRHQVIPALKTINPAVVNAIARFSDHLGIVEGANRSEMPVVTETVGEPSMQLTVVNGISILELCNISSATDLPSQIRSYVYAAARTVMESRQTAQAVSIIQRRGTGLVSLTGHKTLVLTQKHGWIYPGNQPTDRMLADYHAKFLVELVADFLDSAEHSVNSPASVAAMDGSSWNVQWPGGEGLILRNRRAGDRIGSKLLGKLLIDFKIPWYIRPFAVVATNEQGKIVAVAGLSQDLNEWIGRHTNSDFQLTATKSVHTV